MAATWLIAAPAQSANTGDQMIVKFTAQSEAGRALARMDLAAIADPAGDARLVELAQELGERIGIPLRLASLTSGRELLLEVDHQALASALAEALRQRDDVTGVEVLDPAGQEQAPRLAVEFESESAFAEMVASGSGVAVGPLSGGGDLEAEVLSSDRGRAVLAPDPDALIGTLLARVEADPDVQYAQPNLRLRPYRAQAGGES
jgi:hypothetical protein